MAAKRGRPPNPETRGKAVRLYLSAAAIKVLATLPDGGKSAYVSRLIEADAGRSAT